MSRSTTLAALAVTGLSTLAVLASTGCSADLSDALTPAVQPTAPAHAPAEVTTRDTAPGGSQLGQKAPSGKQADKATQVHMNVTNKTGQVLNLISATSSGMDAHWQNRPTDLAPGQTTKASNYAADDAQIVLTYVGASDGTVYTLLGETPLAGGNSATGTSTNASYDVAAKAGSGYNPTMTYAVQPGHAFGYAGSTDTYTVPVGVTSLQVTAVGGTGGVSDAASGADPERGAGGAKISGTLAVTPGEVLTVAVGGSGSNSSSDVAGGWGMPYEGSTFSGGNGVPGTVSSAGGGGATVVLRADGTPVVVAGGGGGWGGAPEIGNGTTAGEGGQGGAGGALIGGSGEGDDDQGGAGGAASTSQGEDGQAGSNRPGGAGGGGAAGGESADGGTAAGGGAGSSSDDGLTNPDVGVGSNSRTQNGTVVFSAAS